jgi:hypothetical protein
VAAVLFLRRDQVFLAVLAVVHALKEALLGQAFQDKDLQAHLVQLQQVVAVAAQALRVLWVAAITAAQAVTGQQVQFLVRQLVMLAVVVAALT